MDAPIPSTLKVKKHCETALYKSLALAMKITKEMITQMPKDIKYGCNERLTCTLFDMSYFYRQAYEMQDLQAKLDFLKQCISKAREFETYVLFLHDSCLTMNKRTFSLIATLGDVFYQLSLWIESTKNKIKDKNSKIADNSEVLQRECGN